MFENKLFFGYASKDDFFNSDIFGSTSNFMHFLSGLNDDDVKKLSDLVYKTMYTLERNEPPSFNHFKFILYLMDRINTGSTTSNIFYNYAHCYYCRAWESFTQNPSDVIEGKFAAWLFPDNILENQEMIDGDSMLLSHTLEALCQLVGMVYTDMPMFDRSFNVGEWYAQIKRVNIKFIKDGTYIEEFPQSLSKIINLILCKDIYQGSNVNICKSIQWNLLNKRLNKKMLDISIKYSANGITITSMHYAILAAVSDTAPNDDVALSNVYNAIEECLNDMAIDRLKTIQLRPMVLLEVINAVKDTMFDISDPRYRILNNAKDIDTCKTIINKAVERAESHETPSNACAVDESVDLTEESIPRVITQAINYLDRWSFDYISGDEITVVTEAYDSDEYPDHAERKKRREKADERNEHRRAVSEKLRSGSAKVYHGYKTYKENEEKVDSQLAKIIKALTIGNGGIHRDRIRDEIVEGKKFSPINILKDIIGTVALFSVNKVAAVITVVTHFYLKDKVTNEERKRVCQELEAEIEMVNEKIEDARADGNREAKYNLMRTKHNLELALKKIKARATKSNIKSSTNEAKMLVRRNAE